MVVQTMRVKVLLLTTVLTTVCGFAAASTLDVSVAGQFSSGVTTTQLSAPGANWAISFDVPSSPVASNTDTLGFDTSFSGFSYTLNGSLLAVAPDFIRFATSSNQGLFTLFFGSESGIDSNGNPIPEFSFQGPQAFSGTTSNPSILPGSYSVTTLIYSDAVNYDQHAGGQVGIAVSSVPEPAGWSMLLVAAGMGLLVIRRGIFPAKTQ